MSNRKKLKKKGRLTRAQVIRSLQDDFRSLEVEEATLLAQAKARQELGEGDDFDDYLKEQLQDPEYAAAYYAALEKENADDARGSSDLSVQG